MDTHSPKFDVFFRLKTPRKEKEIHAYGKCSLYTLKDLTGKEWEELFLILLRTKRRHEKKSAIRIEVFSSVSNLGINEVCLKISTTLKNV